LRAGGRGANQVWLPLSSRRNNKETPLNCREEAEKFKQAVAGVEKVRSPPLPVHERCPIVDFHSRTGLCCRDPLRGEMDFKESAIERIYCATVLARDLSRLPSQPPHLAFAPFLVPVRLRHVSFLILLASN
jgi:hypothetical protein